MGGVYSSLVLLAYLLTCLLQQPNKCQQSLKRLDPPAWIRQQSPLPPLVTEEPKRTRPRYSDHRRSYSAQRGAVPSASASFWRTTTSSSREPSPGPGSRPATAAGRFQS